MKLLKRETKDEFVVAAIDGQECRVHHFNAKSQPLAQIVADKFSYADLNDLEDKLINWSKQHSIKNIGCCWILSRELYNTHIIDAPNVLEKEMSEAIKWQIKDLLEYPVNDVLLSYYKPKHVDPLNIQVVAVAVEKKLVESLIKITQSASLKVESIEINELAIGMALLPYLGEGKITGFIGEDDTGLVFNFYSGDELAFSRHKKGRFMPAAASQEFSLDSDQEDQEEAFLLETQRTLDYVITQLFRRPVDTILLQKRNTDGDSLANAINQLTETHVIQVSPDFTTNQQDIITPNLAEIGCALGVSS